MPYGRKCLVCKNTRHRERGLRLFRFPPRDSPLRARWLEACGLTEADIDVNAREPPRLCHHHFQPKDFLTRQLSGTAVPRVSTAVKVLTEVVEEIVDPAVLVEDDRVDGAQQVIEEIIFEGEIEPEQLTEFNGSIDESLKEVELYQDLESLVPVEEAEQSSEEQVNCIVEDLTSSDKLCNDEAHMKLLEELQAERAKNELLMQELEEKNKVLTGQQELLSQLGVQFVIYNN